MLLRDRSDELAEAGIRPFGLSRDSLWSHRAWAETLGVEVPLLTDWEGDVVRAFGADRDVSGMSGVPRRSAFLIEDGETIVAAWMLGSELPDLDAVIATAKALSFRSSD
jgi:peroxiredoxin